MVLDLVDVVFCPTIDDQGGHCVGHDCCGESIQFNFVADVVVSSSQISSYGVDDQGQFLVVLSHSFGGCLRH